MSKESFLKNAVNGIFDENPLLAGGLALLPAAMAAYSLKNAVFIAGFFVLPVMLSALVFSLLGSRLPSVFRLPVLAVFNACVLFLLQLPARHYFPARMEELGAFVPLLAVSSLLFVPVMNEAEQQPLLSAVVSAFGRLLGYGAVICLLGAVREILSNGTVFEISLPVNPSLYAFSLPFSGLILAGFGAALLAYIREKKKEVEACKQPEN